MKTNPYIGITDFTSFDQVEKMLAVFNSNVPASCNYLLHVGVMMSFKTLHNIDTKWSVAFPPKESIAKIFSSDEVFNCLHYVDYNNKEDLANSLESAIYYGGKNLDAIQLDTIWPSPKIIREVFKDKNLSVILQIGKNAFEEVDEDPRQIIKRISMYGNSIQYVLLDKSMGKGLGMNAYKLMFYIEKIKREFPHLRIVVAGGLGPTTMYLAKDIFERYKGISIDAQGRLRPSGNALEPIDWSMAETYLTKAVNMVCK